MASLKAIFSIKRPYGSLGILPLDSPRRAESAHINFILFRDLHQNRFPRESDWLLHI